MASKLILLLVNNSDYSNIIIVYSVIITSIVIRVIINTKYIYQLVCLFSPASLQISLNAWNGKIKYVKNIYDNTLSSLYALYLASDVTAYTRGMWNILSYKSNTSLLFLIIELNKRHHLCIVYSTVYVLMGAI